MNLKRHISVLDEYDAEGSLTLWSGSFASDYEGTAVPFSDDSGTGYHVTTDYYGSVNVYSPFRTDANFVKVDKAINRAMNEA